jgi:tyrosine-protein phosphatase YwqE
MATVTKFFDLFKSKYSLLSGDVLKGMTDHHSHILFGVDDGLKTLEDSLQVLEFMEKEGVAELWCTPHVMEDKPNTTEQLKTRFGELQNAYHGSIRLNLAAEYMLDTIFEERFSSKDLLLMKDNTVLVETSTWNPPPSLYETLRNILSAGYRPLLAHPERYRYLSEPSYERLHKMGVHFQLNLASLIGYYGETAMRKAHWILENGWYSSVGTDCHRFKILQEQLDRAVLKKETLEFIKCIK